MNRNIKIKTAAQDIVLSVLEDLTLEEVLRINRIPTNLFQGYLIRDGAAQPIPLDRRLSEIPAGVEVVLQCIRNTDLRQVYPQKAFHKKTANPTAIIHDLNFADKECTETIYELNDSTAKKIVENKVSDFIKKYSQSQKLIAGISGGGDSNTLVRSLKSISRKRGQAKELICFTLVFDPIWPVSGAKRAAALCAENDVRHFIYRPEALEALLEMKGSLEDFYSEFSRNFGEKTSHFFATYLISLVARKLCRQHQTDEYCLGFNREDVLAEMLFSIMNGHKPLAFPVRQFGEIKLLMPLWEIPKIVLDTCYPKYSLANYRERDDMTTFQRGTIYYLAHGIDEVYSNLGLTLMHGVRKIFAHNWSELQVDKRWDLYISEYAEASKVKEVKDLLRRYFKFPM